MSGGTEVCPLLPRLAEVALYLSFAALFCLPFAVDALDQVLLVLRRQLSQLLVVELLWKPLGIAYAATVARLCESILWFLC